MSHSSTRKSKASKARIYAGWPAFWTQGLSLASFIMKLILKTLL